MKNRQHKTKPFGIAEILCAGGMIICLALFLFFLGRDAGMRTRQRRVKEQISAAEQNGSDSQGVITVVKETETQPQSETTSSGDTVKDNTTPAGNGSETQPVKPEIETEQVETEPETEIETAAETETETEAEPQTEPQTETQTEPPVLPAQPITEAETETPATETETPATETETEYYPLIADAQKINEDIFGTLEFGDDQALYVVQGTDNDYYLSHDFTGAPSAEGAAMLDARETIEPRSQNWIIHGHNMRNGAIFGTLKEYRNLEFLQAHPVITLTRLHAKETWLIYAVLDINTQEGADGYFDMLRFDFETPQEFQDYTGYLCSHSYYTLPVDVKDTDPLLMLSTCSYGYSDGRLLVACRKLRDGENLQECEKMYAGAEYSGVQMVY